MKAIIHSDDEIDVPMYEEDDESSEIILLLNNEDEVSIIEEHEVFSLVEFIDEKTSAVYTGYVDNNYLLKELENEANQQSKNKEQVDLNTEEKNDTNNVANEEHTGNKENNKSDEPSLRIQNGPQTFSVQTNQVKVNQKTLRGVALKDPTRVYEKTDLKNSKVLKEYPVGSILKYKTYSNDWYEATVYINGKQHTGYIHKSHVENVEDKQENLQGIALKDPTHVYARASTKANKLKSYPVGSILKYKTLSNNWYQATIYVNGKARTGYIHKSHVENRVDKQQTLQGVALNTSTHVYAKASTKANKLKSYPAGTILKYKTFSNNWYEATVYIKGKAHKGFIHKNHVDNTVSSRGKTYYSYGIKHPTHVYASPSTKAKKLKSYNYGTRLKYQALSENWYLATVYISGKAHKGYIAKSDLSNSLPAMEQGYAQSKLTNVYQSSSKNSKVLKSYFAGSLLKYRPFNNSWYIATVYLNGKANIGFIHKNDVGNKVNNIAGYAQLEPTKVYESTSKNSKVLKDYRAGQVLQFRPHNDSWYKATVYVNGSKKTGYIHKADVGNKIPSLEGYAQLQPTRVYASTSITSKVLKSYKQGTVLKYQPYSNSWYRAKVKVNGKWQYGYIHRNHVSSQIRTNYNISLNEALNMQMKASPQTDTKYGWISKKYVNSNYKTTANLNVRIGPGESHKLLGTLPKGKTVKVRDEYNGWYAIEYTHSTQWVHASPKDVRYYLDPNNFINDEVQRLQFLDLSVLSGASVSLLNNYLKGKGSLSGQGKAFIEAGKIHGVNEVYLISHAILETGNGSSNLATGKIEVGEISNNKYFVQIPNNSKRDKCESKAETCYFIAEYKQVKKNGKTVWDWVISETNNKTRNSAETIKKIYNMFGIGAYDRNPEVFGAIKAYQEEWFKPEDAIKGGAKFIGEDYIHQGQNTLYKMRWNPSAMVNNGYATHQYATDIAWASKQVHRIYDLYKQIGINTFYLDIPVYK